MGSITIIMGRSVRRLKLTAASLQHVLLLHCYMAPSLRKESHDDFVRIPRYFRALDDYQCYGPIFRS